MGEEWVGRHRMKCMFRVKEERSREPKKGCCLVACNFSYGAILSNEKNRAKSEEKQTKEAMEVLGTIQNPFSSIALSIGRQTLI